MFRHDEAQSREYNLQKAKEFSEQAKQHLETIKTAIAAANRLVPLYGRTKTQNEKYASAGEVISRLETAVHTHSRLVSTYASRDAQAREVEAKRQQEERLALAKQEQSQLLGEAIIFLHERAKVLGVDYTVETAISLANEIAFEEECQRREQGEGYQSFSGQNCEDPCEGWIPGNRRCECGNRRVAWTEGYSHSFKNPSVHAEAW